MIQRYTIVDVYGEVQSFLEIDADSVSANIPAGCTAVEGFAPSTTHRLQNGQWVERPASPGRGFQWDAPTAAWVQLWSLDALKLHKAEQILAGRRVFEQGDFTVGGATFLADESSRTMLANTLVLAREYEETTAQPFSTVWKLATGGVVTLTRAQLRDLALALGARVQQAFVREAQIRAALAAATTTEAVAAIQWTDPT